MNNKDQIYCYSVHWPQTGYTKYVIARHLSHVLDWAASSGLNINGATIEKDSVVLGTINTQEGQILRLYSFLLVSINSTKTFSILSESVQNAYDKIAELYPDYEVIKISMLDTHDNIPLARMFYLSLPVLLKV